MPGILLKAAQLRGKKRSESSGEEIVGIPVRVKVEFEVRRLFFPLFNEVKRRHTRNVALAQCSVESKGQQIVILVEIRFTSDQTLFRPRFPASKARVNISIVCTAQRERQEVQLLTGLRPLLIGVAATRCRRFNGS